MGKAFKVLFKAGTPLLKREHFVRYPRPLRRSSRRPHLRMKDDHSKRDFVKAEITVALKMKRSGCVTVALGMFDPLGPVYMEDA